jgi:hypothetical protein
MSEFQYFNSSLHTFSVLASDNRIYDDKASTVTYRDFYEVENKTGQTADDVVLVLPYVWAVVDPPTGVDPLTGLKADDQTLSDPDLVGPPGRLALDFENGAWTVEDFNGMTGLDLKVTAKIVPLDHSYTTGSIAAGSIASDPSLQHVLGPSSVDEKIPYAPETLERFARHMGQTYPQWRKNPAASCGVTLPSAGPSASCSASAVRAATRRSSAFTLAQAGSMGLRSGE